MNITVVGNVCIDKNISEDASYTSAGGPAIFMDRIFKNFPNTSFNIIAPWGIDFLFHKKDIHLLPNKATAKNTLVYENKSHGNKRSQKAYRTNNAGRLVLGKVETDILINTDILYIAPLVPTFSNEIINEIVSTSKRALKILLPQGYFRGIDSSNNVVQREFIEEDCLLPLFDYTIVSEEDHKDMHSKVVSWSSKTQVIMTLGDKGAVHINKGKKIYISTDKVEIKEIVDSVGSGDIFSASFGYKYALTGDTKESILFANQIARKCLFYIPNDIHHISSEHSKSGL